MPEGKKRKKAKVRTDRDLLQMGAHGQVFLIVRKAFALGSKNNFSGTVRQGKKYGAAPLYSKGKEGGAFWKLAGDSDEFKNIKSEAKKALSELKKDPPKYGDGVKGLIDEFSSIGGSGRGGSALNMSALNDISL